MKILLHSKVFYPSIGGLERVSHNLADALGRLGVDVTVLTETPTDGSDRKGCYRVVRRASRAEKKSLVEWADVVHVNGFSLELAPYCLVARRPLVWTHAGHQASCLVGDGRHRGYPCGHRLATCFRLTRAERGLSFALRHAAELVLRRAALRLAARNVCVSSWVARSIRAPRSVVIWNPVDIRLADEMPADATPGRFTFLGRLVREKGVDSLLAALAVCRDRGKVFGVDVYGDGPERNRLESLARSLAVADLVAFHGMVEGAELARAMARAWIVVVPSSYEEAMGIVAVEAMAAGKPLIVSRDGGLAEVSAECSLIFPNDDYQSLARQMIRLAGSPSLRNRMARLGPIKALQFASERIARCYAMLYEEVVKERS